MKVFYYKCLVEVFCALWDNKTIQKKEYPVIMERTKEERKL